MNLSLQLRRLAVVALLPVALSSCATTRTGADRLIAKAPKEELFRKELKRELSTLNVSVEMSAAELAEELNRVAPKELYRGGTGTSGLSLVMARKGRIGVTVANNQLNVTIPVSISLSYGIFQTPTISNNLRFRVSANVTPDWKVNAAVYYTGLSDAVVEELGIGPLSIRPRSIVEGATQPLQRTLSTVVSRKLNDTLKLDEKMAKVWEQAQKPVLLERKYNAWAVFSPQEVVLYPLYAQNNQLRINVGLTSYAEVVIGPEPPAPKPLPLPRLKLATAADRGFRVAINTDLFYKDLLNIASPLLLNKDWGKEGRSVILKGLDLYGNGEHLLIKVDLAGTVEGTFFMIGKPVFDPRRNLLSVQDLDFDLDSRNLLVTSADWFLHGTFQRALQEKLTMDLTPRLAQAREMAAKSMAHVKLRDNIFLNSTLSDLKVNDLLVQRDHLSLQLYLQGETSVIFH